MTRRASAPVIIAQRQINMFVKCPECQKPAKTSITKILMDCPHCNKVNQVVDISYDEREEYGLQVLKTALFIIIKELQHNDEIKIQARDNYLLNVKQLIELVKPFGIKVIESGMVTTTTLKTQEKITVNQFILAKDEQLKYLYGGENEGRR